MAKNPPKRGMSMLGRPGFPVTIKETTPDDVAKQLDDLEQKLETRLSEIYQLLREIKSSLAAGERNDE